MYLFIYIKHRIVSLLRNHQDNVYTYHYHYCLKNNHYLRHNQRCHDTDHNLLISLPLRVPFIESYDGKSGNLLLFIYANIFIYVFVCISHKIVRIEKNIVKCIEANGFFM